MTGSIRLYRVFLIVMLLLVSLRSSPIATSASDTEPYTNALAQSAAAYPLWTTPPGERVFKDAGVPTTTGSEVKVYAAKNEFEPFQVVVKPVASGNVVVSLDSFGSGITAELYQVKYVNITQVSNALIGLAVQIKAINQGGEALSEKELTFYYALEA